ncbi:hypothetical protein J5N97_016725 [Dioscorea zingiberensis]|uniref:Chorein N-terminal domain-containing protein n=1 Tax=Dioscorea zingiberensis TaxID=325984 RepID=A0A9D5HFP4_9LILI|nr:hypothetical protein J5N97_016725 [Dioscorea zingiberensis]
MESIIAKALEYTLKYWLKSFSRDQFKLQGRTAQLYNLDINGDVLHASIGLPPALNVSTARVGKLEIMLPSVSYVQTEPIVVQIDKLDVVLEENVDSENSRSSCSAQSSTSSSKGSGYGFADKIADGMTIEVGVVNLLIETQGGAEASGRASPLASVTIRNLLLYTTNENWQVVNLKEARDFSNNKKFIYVFKKLEWASLSVDLLPHPDMFTDACLASSNNEGTKHDDDGAKRLFFGGERFLEGISGEAFITVQRTEQNAPLGLEVRLHVTEAVCPSLSEPGLRALLRFFTGLYVCLNRGDVDPKARQRSTEAAGRSIVSIVIDHIFLCIKDADFRLELLMQSLLFFRASVSNGEDVKNLSRIMVGGLFLRDTFSHPPCTLIQPSMQAVAPESLHVPEFGENFCPSIYPLGDQLWQFNMGVPLICLHSLQIKPSPAPPSFASQTVIDCQPLMISLQEESCFRISSFLADGIVVNPGAVLPDFSINSFIFNLKEFDLIVPIDAGKNADFAGNINNYPSSLFYGARLHVEDLYFSQSPSIKCKLLNLEKDPACFSLWEYQPIDASQRKWTTQASHLSLSLETCSGLKMQKSSMDWSAGLWQCIELQEICFEAAMVTADGGPLLNVPPPEGVVRIGVACQQFSSNASVDQLFFVLDIYAYFGRVSEKIRKVGKNKTNRHKIKEPIGEKLMKKIPSDTAVSLAVNKLHLRFLESSSTIGQEMPLVHFAGDELFLKVSHLTLGGAFAVSTTLHWENIHISCVDGEGLSSFVNGTDTLGVQNLLAASNGHPLMRAIFWIDKERKDKPRLDPFLDISIVHVMPYNVQDVECHSLNISAKISGVRLGGGMNYTESLLHQFGMLGPDGGPGEGLSKGLKKLSSGPLAKLFRASPLMETEPEENGSIEDAGILKLGMPDDVDVSFELKNWLFALEGTGEMRDERLTDNFNDFSREEKCWHTTFKSLKVKAKNSQTANMNGGRLCKARKYPVESIMVSIEGLQALKPRSRSGASHPNMRENYRVDKHAMTGETTDAGEGVDVEACLVISDDEIPEETSWVVENIRFIVKQPIEAVVTKDELEHLVVLCKSEVDSMGRIAAGVLRLLKLEESIGLATLDQLSNLGTGITVP